MEGSEISIPQESNFLPSFVSGCYWTKGLITVCQTSHLHHPPYSSSFSCLRVTMETPLAHTLLLFLPKPHPHKRYAIITEVYILSTDVCLVCMYSACWASVLAHAHHLGHKVSLVHGTWVLWFAGSSLWSVLWWLWSNRKKSNWNLQASFKDILSGSHHTSECSLIIILHFFTEKVCY